MDIDLSTLTNSEFALLRKRVAAEHTRRTSKPSMDVDDMYQLFTTNFTTFAKTWEVDIVSPNSDYDEIAIDSPYEQPTLQEFEVLVKRFKTAAKTEKGILGWMERAWMSWCEILANKHHAVKKHILAIQGLEYRLKNEISFPRTFMWSEPLTIKEKKAIASKVPHLTITWGKGGLTVTE